MTRERCIFQNLKFKDGAKVIFGGNRHRQVIGGG